MLNPIAQTKNIKIPRTYVVHLQSKVQVLEDELRGLSQEQYEPPDADLMARSGGYVRFHENDEGRYLGPSSGIAITRLVMELAKQNTDTKTIKEIVPESKAQQIKARFAREEGKPTSKVYPKISEVAAPSLPSRSLSDSLVENFNRKAQYMWPTLHEPSFLQVVTNVYTGSTDPYENFTLRMVIAISMQKLSTQYAGLADAFYLAALQYLESAVRPMNVGTIQCFALIAQYSLLTPTRTAAYWVVGMAARLCQELGITEEATIEPKDDGKLQSNAIDIDMRRRLFWVITSMEFGLAHSLGRPSAFGTTFDHIDVGFFETVDDRDITPAGVVPNSPKSIKKCIAIHFFKMRLLQAEIRRMLYLKRRPEPNSDRDPWFQYMMAKLNEWRQSAPRNDEGSGLSEKWFQGRLNTMIVFLYRPSPQVPKPSADAARLCFEASLFNIQMQREQITTSSVDLTWIFTQSLFMALNAILWALSYPEIRREYTKERVEDSIDVAQEAISLASERWPGVESALELYQNLIAACLKAYDGNSDISYVVDSSSSKASPASLRDATTPPPLPSPFFSTPYHDHQVSRSSSAGYQQHLSPTLSTYSVSDPGMPNDFPNNVMPQMPRQSSFDYGLVYQESPFNPDSMFNPFPQNFPVPQSNHASANDSEQYLCYPGEQYSQYLHAAYMPQQPVQALNQEQQAQLMRNLENTPLDWL
ncbi:hypothetical protein ACLMJK_004180 [Lecanora helva]